MSGWTNSGTGGSDYDLTTVVGTAANLTRITVNGHYAAQAAGSVGIEPTTGQTINDPATVFAVAKFTDAAPSADQYLLDSKSSAADRWVILSDTASANRFAIWQGGGVVAAISENYDQDAHVFTGEFLGTAATKLSVSGLGSVSGNVGAANWDYCTLFFRHDELSRSMQGYIQHFLVFDYALTATEVAAVIRYLKDTYGTV